MKPGDLIEWVYKSDISTVVVYEQLWSSIEQRWVPIGRGKEELGVIKQMKNADYFVSYQKIMELARKRCLVGPGRGCFVPETRVLMADGMHAPIGTIKPGDIVKDADSNDQRCSRSSGTKLALHKGLTKWTRSCWSSSSTTGRGSGAPRTTGS